MFYIWTMDKKLSNESYFIPRGQNAASLRSFEVGQFLRKSRFFRLLEQFRQKPPKRSMHSNHGRIRRVKNGWTAFFPFWNWAMDKKLSNESHFIPKRPNAASLSSFKAGQFLGKPTFWRKHCESIAKMLKELCAVPGGSDRWVASQLLPKMFLLKPARVYAII